MLLLFGCKVKQKTINSKLIVKFFLLVILTDTGKALADYCLVACFMPSWNLA